MTSGALLDHGAHVGMQRRDHATALGVVGEPIEIGEQGLPAKLVELGSVVVSVDAGEGGEHDNARPLMRCRRR